MSGFTEYDEIINALTVSEYGQALSYLKATGFTTAAASQFTHWNSNGSPGQGTYSGTAEAAQACTSATTGAMPFTDATSPRKMWLLGGDAFATGSAGSLLLWDRLIYYPGIDHTLNTLRALNNTTTLPRYTTGKGVFAFLEVTSTLGATAQTCTLTYTDQDGNGSASTGAHTIIASSAISRLPHGFLWFPLAAGDTGIRQVDSLQFSASNTTGTSALVLARLIAKIPIPAVGVTQPLDLVRGPQLSLPQIEDGAALFFTFHAVSAAASPNFVAALQLCEN